MPPYALLALISAGAYSIGSLFNKQAMAGGCGYFRVTAFTIWSSALFLLPFVFLYSAPLPLNVWYQPFISAIFFSSGSIFFILALRTGDLSIVAPVSGIKPIINALLVAVLLNVDVPMSTWIACGLTAIALVVLRTPNTSTSHSFLKTTWVTLLCVTSFALCDTCFQRWANNWGVLRFAAITFTTSSIVACAMIPLFNTPWKKMTQTAKRHVLTGAAFCALPGLCMGLALGRYGHAPEVNVIYSTRAIFSIGIVWLFGRHIGNIEHTASRTVLFRRMAGATILLAAIILILFN